VLVEVGGACMCASVQCICMYVHVLLIPMHVPDMNLHRYVCAGASTWIRACICTCMCIFYMYGCMCVHVCVCVNVCVSASTHIRRGCVYVCMHVGEHACSKQLQ
jgi:hypothetical protein